MRKCITFTINSFIPVFLILLLSNYNFCLGGILKGGVAKVNITPPVGIILTGSGGKPSDSIIDELYVKALVLDDGRNTIAIVSADLVGIPLEITTRIRGIIEEKVGISQNNILICATHTHSGPRIYTRTKAGMEIADSEIDKHYVETLIKKIAGSVFIAFKNMKEVKVGIAKGEIPEIVFNRRPQKSIQALQVGV